MSKDKHKVTNWSDYNSGLKQRGSLKLWINSDIVSGWKYQGSQQRGGAYLYSDAAIEWCLVIHKLYHLPLRQTEGFIKSVFELLDIRLPVPCYTTMCRRSRSLPLQLYSTAGGGSTKPVTDIVVDSTGLKVYGEGEWKVRKHGAGKHRTWMKLHVAADCDTQQIAAVKLTTNAVDDASELKPLLEAIDHPLTRSVCADGAYDKNKVRKLLYKQKINQLIPPQHNAVVDKQQRKYKSQRDDAIRTIAAIGRSEWKKQQGYHRRSKAETVMFRYKTILGDRLSARKIGQQQTEAAIGCKILNQLLNIAKPISVKIA